MRVRELRIEYRPHPSGATIDGRTAAQPKHAAAILRPVLEHQPQEVFVLLLLNTKRRVLGLYEVSRGGMDSAIIDPKVVFRAALLANATAIVLAHNHPSGDPTPSPYDLDLTQRLTTAGRILDIEVLDHIIIGDESYCSFQETGRM